jgi:hypothetical protein
VRAYLPVDDIQLPVVIELTTDFRLRYSAHLETGINTSITFAHDNQLDVALRYENADWSGSYQVDPTYNLGWAPLSGATKVLIDLELKPVLTARIYGVDGPQLAVALRQQLVGQVNEPSQDWDFSASTWLETQAAIDARIFGETLADHSQTWETERLTYHTPFQLKKVSGDQQMQAPGLPLADPIEVRVLDEFGRPQPRVPVYFKVQAGEGSVEPESVLTDANGVAAASWTLGAEPETGNTLLVEVMKADGSDIMASPLRFTAGSTFLDTVSFAGTWLMIAHANMDCIENEDEFIRVANNQGLICHEDCTSSIVCNNGCARTIFEFAGTNVRIYSHLFDLSGVFLETDTIDYTLSFTGSNTLALIDPLDPTNKYDIEFTLNDNELDFFATQTANAKDCKEEILLRRQ